MSLLTAKSSSQQFLLRLLKVVIQLSDKKPAASSTGAASAPVTETASATVAATDNDQAGAPVTAETGDNVTTANTNNGKVVTINICIIKELELSLTLWFYTELN